MEEVDVEEIQRRLGSGKFQMFAFIVLGLIYSRGAWHVFGIMFLAGDPGHRCALPSLSGETDNDRTSVLPSPYPDTRKLEHSLNGSSSLNAAHGVPTTDSLPTRVEVDSVMYTLDGESVDVTMGNWTAEVCGVSYVTLNGSSVTLKDECPYGWSYGSVFEKTVLSEWDLVCGRDFLVELSATVFMVGATVGAMLILPLADRFGRRQVMFACLLCQACVGTATAFVNSYALFTALRFIIGMINIGVGLCSYVLMTESFPAQRRTVVSIGFQAFWAVGVMTLAGFGFLVRHWRHLELLLSLPNLLALPCYWLLPESLPWLVSQKRWKEAKSAAAYIAQINGKENIDFSCLFPNQCSNENSSEESLTLSGKARDRNTEIEAVIGAVNNKCSGSSDLDCEQNGGLKLLEDSDTKSTLPASCDVEESRVEVTGGGMNGDARCAGKGKSGKQSEKSSFLDLFRHRRMRLYSCIMFFLFFINSLGYFGISFSVPVLHGNPFVNLCIMGLVEIPANFICVMISQRMGRRYPNAAFLLLCGISNIVALFAPVGPVKLVFVMLGKFAITAAYSTIYLYSAEIFPTAIRNQAMGMSSVFENIGGISAPFMVLAAKSIAELPLVVFGVLCILGGCLTLLLPETHNRPLPQTVQEITTW